MTALIQQIATLVELPDTVVYGVGSATYSVFGPMADPFDKLLHSALPGPMATVDAWATGSTLSPIAAKLPLLSNPSYVLFALVAYFVALALLYVIGQKVGPMKIKTVSTLHNCFLFLLSFYMWFGVAVTAMAAGYSLWNMPFGDASNPWTWRMAKLIWLFYVSKLPEFGDTFIMMIKHNYRQVSFLHLYHHCTIFAVWYVVTSRAPGGDAYWSAFLNSGVHVVMYGYYFLTAIFPEGAVRNFLNSVKFYITKMQMLQFLCNVLQTVYLLWVVPRDELEYPAYLVHLLFWYMWTLLALFGNFLIRNSGKKSGGKKPAASGAAAAAPAPVPAVAAKAGRSTSPRATKKKSA